MLKVVEVALVKVGLTLKANAKVGVATHHQPYAPFNKIDDIERKVEQLAHLRRVNALMVYQPFVDINAGVHKEHSKQVDCHMTTQRW